MNNNSMHSRKNAARTERQQQRLESGLLSAHFPEVASVVISMVYNQKGIAKALPRTVNFFPTSHALFRVDCLNKDCLSGGFDLTEVITSMIRNRRKIATGDLSCEGNGPSADHSAIVYEVTIQYA